MASQKVPPASDDPFLSTLARLPAMYAARLDSVRQEQGPEVVALRKQVTELTERCGDLQQQVEHLTSELKSVQKQAQRHAKALAIVRQSIQESDMMDLSDDDVADASAPGPSRKRAAEREGDQKGSTRRRTRASTKGGTTDAARPDTPAGNTRVKETTAPDAAAPQSPRVTVRELRIGNAVNGTDPAPPSPSHTKERDAPPPASSPRASPAAENGANGAQRAGNVKKRARKGGKEDVKGEAPPAPLDEFPAGVPQVYIDAAHEAASAHDDLCLAPGLPDMLDADGSDRMDTDADEGDPHHDDNTQLQDGGTLAGQAAPREGENGHAGNGEVGEVADDSDAHHGRGGRRAAAGPDAAAPAPQPRQEVLVICNGFVAMFKVLDDGYSVTPSAGHHVQFGTQELPQSEYDSRFGLDDLSPADYEGRCGKGSSKKWKTSIYVYDVDAGKRGANVGKWLVDMGYE